MKGFGSDNHAGVHPRIFEALQKSNVDHAPAYGTDEWSERAVAAFRSHFGPNAQIFFVFNGTAANILALKSLCQSFESILCSEVAHLNVDECGAPEYFLGAKLLTRPHRQGLLDLEDCKAALIRRGDQHFSQARVLSLTLPTEYGTCYSIQQMREFCDWAHSERLYVHVDGARLANAVVALKTSFKELLTDSGVDVVSFGGTKNGLMFGEAVVFLNPDLAENFKYIRKQGAQLPSKTRFIAAQFEAYFDQNLWREIAEHSLQMAQFLADEIRKIPGVQITCEIQSNAVFAIFPRAWIKPLREHAFFYVWNEHSFECRLMTSWDTTREDIINFVRRIKELAS